MPRTQDGTEKQEIEQMVACLDGPDFEAMARKQFVHQVGWRDKAEPEHEPSQRACARGRCPHRVQYEGYKYSLDECSDDRKDVDHRVWVARLARFSDACPPGREKQLWVIPNKTTDHAYHHADNNCQPIDITEIWHESLQ